MNLASPWAVLTHTLGLRHDYEPTDDAPTVDKGKLARVLAAQKESARQRSERMRKQIIDIIQAADGLLSTPEIAHALGQRKPNGNLFRHMKEIGESGVIRVVKTTNKYKSSTYLYGRI